MDKEQFLHFEQQTLRLLNTYEALKREVHTLRKEKAALSMEVRVLSEKNEKVSQRVQHLLNQLETQEDLS